MRSIVWKMTSKRLHRFSLPLLAIVDMQEGVQTERMAMETMMMIVILEGILDETMMIDGGLEAPAPEDLAEAAAETALAEMEAAAQADTVEVEAAGGVAAEILIRRTALKVGAHMGAADTVIAAPM